MAFRVAFLLLSLLSIACTMSSAALVTGGILGGVLSCTNTSLATAGTLPPIPGVPVDVVCASGSLQRVIASTVTSTAGAYFFLFTTIDSALNDPGTPCFLRVSVPSVSCNFNVPTGLLTAPITVLSTVDAVLGAILVLVPGLFSFVPVV